jgi:hypothetical protein
LSTAHKTTPSKALDLPYRRNVPEKLTGGNPAAAAPDTRALAIAGLELAGAARRASDFARGMVPTGYSADLEPGELAQDALRLADHARQVLVAAIRHERARGTGQTVIGEIVNSADASLAEDLMIAAGSSFPAVGSEAIADRLFELDS